LMRGSEERKKTDQEDVVDLIASYLKGHEIKFSQMLDRLENRIFAEVNPDELRNYGSISIQDKRGPYMVEYGQIVKSNHGVHGLELSTDRGYVIVFSGPDKHGKQPLQRGRA
jgi:hypothetical protein